MRNFDDLVDRFARLRCTDAEPDASEEVGAELLEFALGERWQELEKWQRWNLINDS